MAILSARIWRARLRDRLTVLFVALFAVTLGLIALVVYAAAAADVERNGRTQLATTATVFERLMASRSQALGDQAETLARDYGFRAAFATHDRVTVRSALDNLAARVGIRQAFAVGLDGQAIGGADAVDAALPPDVVREIRDNDGARGFYESRGVVYEAVAAPIRLPAISGWVVFAAEVGAKDTSRLQQLSAVPITASIVAGAPSGWRALAGGARLPHAAARLKPGDVARKVSFGAAGPALALVRPLERLGDSRPALMLRYSLADALKPFNTLFEQILLIGAGALALLALGSWLLARSVTHPISALEGAARALQAGEAAEAPEGEDEIGRLGVRFNAMAREILDREDRLRTALAAAESADRLKGEFLANLNHEFRTPLNGILGGVGAAAVAADPDDRRRALHLVESSGRALERVLNDVLDMVEISAGRPSIDAAPFDLDAALAELERQFASLCAAKGLAFSLVQDEALGHRLGDRRRLLQVLGNLIDNAVKFTPSGSVAVAARRVGEGVRFDVKDTGIGFDPAIVETLFEPFRQQDGAMSRQFGGVGLGLSLSRALARAMGGEVSATAVPGQGACFSLVLPLDPVAAPAERAPSDTAASMRVLLAEDHPANRMVVELILGQAGVDLVCAENGAEAVEAFGRARFDAILMDLQMPVMDGFDAIAAIRRHEVAEGLVRTPIIVLSANIQPEHRARAAALGADLHLAKPIAADQLYAALDQVLDSAADDARRGAAIA